MISSPEIKKIAAEVMQLHGKGADNPEATIEAYLQDCLGEVPLAEKIAFLDRLKSELTTLGSTAQQVMGHKESQALGNLVSLLLGQQYDEITCSTDELLERLADSLNTVFDSLNELILGINTTFIGQSASENETIRLVIRSNVDEGSDSISLQNHLAQIKEAFSIMHQAFSAASMIKMEEMLTELDPQRIEKSLAGGLKIGPFQKAEMFKIYEEKHRTLENWLRTGLLKEALLREFEKHCRQIYAKK